MESKKKKSNFFSIHMKFLKRNNQKKIHLFYRINKESLVKFWQDPSSRQIESIIQPEKKSCTGFNFSGSLSSTRIITRGDGTVEKHQTFKDNQGNEKTVVRRQIGDKVHELIKNRDKSGIESTTENFINMNESKKYFS